MRVAAASVAAGIIIGVGAHILKWLIATVTGWCADIFHTSTDSYWLLITPVVGIVVAACLVRYVFRHPLEGSTEQIRTKIKAGSGVLPFKLTFAPIVANALTLGFGGSAGAEGPIAFSGAAIGSNIGRKLGLTQPQLVMIMACGAAAGIAAIFRAPVGGMFYAIEVLGLALSTSTVIQLALMCVTAAATCFMFSGFSPDMAVDFIPGFQLNELIPAMGLGIFCGLYSAYYLLTGGTVRHGVRKISNPWIQNVVSGVLVSVPLFLFPAIYGEGYDMMGAVVNGHAAKILNEMAFSGRGVVFALIGILAVKGIATYATNSGGGVAGAFAPTLYAGCMAGALYAMVFSQPVGDFALIGMAGVMAGTIRAPFMAVFITVELSCTPQLLCPVAVCAAISYLLSLTLIKKKP